MIAWKELEGSWKKVKGQIQERWGQLTDDDLASVQGNANQLVGTIERKTGETREVIEQFLEELAANGKSFAAKAAGAVRERAAGAARRGYEGIAEGISSGFENTQDTIHRRPVESVAVAFGAGVMLGVVAGLLIRHK